MGSIYSTEQKEIGQLQQLNPRQVKNSLGGYVWEVDDMMKLKRFLFLGVDNSFEFNVVSNEPKRENASCIDRLIAAGEGIKVVELVHEVSLSGRAAKQQPTIFALAVCARCNDLETKQLAYNYLNDICRIPTHLFMFIKYCETAGTGTGWGRAHRRAIVAWYENKCKNPLAAARMVTKYRNREGWKHRDVLRLAHPKTNDPAMSVLLKYIMKGYKEAKAVAEKYETENKNIRNMINFLECMDRIKKSSREQGVVDLTRVYKLEREHIPTQWMHSARVWEELVKNLQMEATIRQLPKITSLALCEEDSDIEKSITDTLTNQTLLKQARVHPLRVLLALKTYETGKGDKGHLKWSPNKNVLKALDSAYYLAFGNVEPTCKRFLLAIDVSISMTMPCIGSSSLTCCEAAAAMMMVTARTENDFDVVAFSHKLTPVDIKKEDSLPEVLKKTGAVESGATDCALPMIWAEEQKKKFDVFIVYTDNETWYGKVHPAEALQNYRKAAGIPDAKLIVVGMASNGFSIADPEDLGMLDIVGFDTAAPQIIAEFSMGKV